MGSLTVCPSCGGEVKLHATNDGSYAGRCVCGHWNVEAIGGRTATDDTVDIQRERERLTKTESWVERWHFVREDALFPGNGFIEVNVTRGGSNNFDAIQDRLERFGIAKTVITAIRGDRIADIHLEQGVSVYRLIDTLIGCTHWTPRNVERSCDL